MMSLFHRLPQASADECKSTTNMQLETKTQNECVGVSNVVDDGPYGAVRECFRGRDVCRDITGYWNHG